MSIEPVRSNLTSQYRRRIVRHLVSDALDLPGSNNRIIKNYFIICSQTTSLSHVHLLVFSHAFSIGLEPREYIGENYHHSRGSHHRMRSRSPPLIREIDISLKVHVGKDAQEQDSTVQMLESWAWSLGEIEKRIRPLFAQKRTTMDARLFLKALLSSEPRKTG
jgi:hypothetical protein